MGLVVHPEVDVIDDQGMGDDGVTGDNRSLLVVLVIVDAYFVAVEVVITNS